MVFLWPFPPPVVLLYKAWRITIATSVQGVQSRQQDRTASLLHRMFSVLPGSKAATDVPVDSLSWMNEPKLWLCCRDQLRTASRTLHLKMQFEKGQIRLFPPHKMCTYYLWYAIYLGWYVGVFHCKSFSKVGRICTSHPSEVDRFSLGKPNSWISLANNSTMKSSTMPRALKCKSHFSKNGHFLLRFVHYWMLELCRYKRMQ